MNHLAREYSTKYLHDGVVDEGSSNTSSVAFVGEDYASRDLASIVEFCRYAMGIYDFQLKKDKLSELRCTREEVEVVHRYLRTQHQSDTWVDESQGGNFVTLLS